MTKYSSSRRRQSIETHDGEFLWLISLSDLMMLLFVFFVVLFSFAWKKLGSEDFVKFQKAISISHQSTETPLDEIQANLLKWVTDRKLLETVEISHKDDALILEIKEKLFFNLGEAQLNQAGLDVLPTLREALMKIPRPYRIGIEGHTDDNPTNQGMSNWQLSVNRALNVHDALRLPEDLESRTEIIGFGPHHPLAPNRDANGAPLLENQAKNRRVTIRIF
jgi:chemotaxis protein MotB